MAGVDEFESMCCCLEGGAATFCEGEGILVKGGGSIDELETEKFCFSAGSGNDGIASSAEDVSTVICVVGTALVRKV